MSGEETEVSSDDMEIVVSGEENGGGANRRQLRELIRSGSRQVVGGVLRQWLIQHRRTLLVIAVIVVAVALTLAACFHPKAQLGTVPAWISAIGAIATCAGVLIAALTYHAQRRDGLEEQANQARLINVRWGRGSVVQGQPTWRVTIENHSQEPVYRVEIHSFCETDGDGRRVRMRSITESVGSLKVLVGNLPVCLKLEKDAIFQTQWRANDNAKVSTANAPAIQYTLTDANGRTWVVADNHEPEKVRRPVRPKKHHRRIL